MKIIFIGNSYTFFNDMPKIFEALANDNAHPCETLMVTKGGRFLWQNIDKDDEFATAVREAVKSEYDVAILQDQSLVALDSPTDFERGVKGHCDLLNAKRILLYATWGRKEGSDKLAERGISSDEMYGKLDFEYKRVAIKLGLEVSNVGKAFKYVYKTHPDIDVYNPDLSHPSYIGSCLAALVHYKTVFGDIPTDLSALQLDENVKAVLIKAVKV